jgi:hypothetical protein
VLPWIFEVTWDATVHYLVLRYLRFSGMSLQSADPASLSLQPSTTTRLRRRQPLPFKCDANLDKTTKRWSPLASLEIDANDPEKPPSSTVDRTIRSTKSARRPAISADGDRDDIEITCVEFLGTLLELQALVLPEEPSAHLSIFNS